MKAKWKKIVAPVIITVILVIYLVGFAAAAFAASIESAGILVVFGLIPLALAGVMIGVCVQRSQEIRSGEEDDLSKY